MKYRIEITEEQAKTIMTALEVFFRLDMGQFEELRWFNQSKEPIDELLIREIKSSLFPELPKNGYRAVTSISDRGKRACEIFQVLRHAVAWSKENNSPETRDWTKQYQVQYDPPFFLLPNEEKPIVETIEDKPCNQVDEMDVESYIDLK